MGVPRKASADEIKSAYRKLSLKFHPDRNDGDKFFEDRFKDINEANEVLSDFNSRLAYDAQFNAYVANRSGRTSNQKEDPSQSSRKKAEPKENNGSDNKGTRQSTHQRREQSSGASSKTDPDPTTTRRTGATSTKASKQTNKDYLAVGIAVACLVGIMTYVISRANKPEPTPVYTPPATTYDVPSPTPPSESLPERTYSADRSMDNSYSDNALPGTDDYFSIGSTKREVERVQGTPTSVNKSDFFDEWSYGLSSIDFENGRVKSYHNISGNLRVRLRSPKVADNEKSSPNYFTLGSSKKQVLRVQGTPSSVNKSDFFDEWTYGLSSIDFENGVVRSYHNITGNLNVIMLPRSGTAYSNSGFFSIGSTKDEVLAVQGTPTAVQKSAFFDEWSYGLSSIDFEYGRVKSYHNISNNLRVSMAGNNSNE